MKEEGFLSSLEDGKDQKDDHQKLIQTMVVKQT